MNCQKKLYLKVPGLITDTIFLVMVSPLLWGAGRLMAKMEQIDPQICQRNQI